MFANTQMLGADPSFPDSVLAQPAPTHEEAPAQAAPGAAGGGLFGAMQSMLPSLGRLFSGGITPSVPMVASPGAALSALPSLLMPQVHPSVGALPHDLSAALVPGR